jgi:hypothetical protein
VRLLEKYVEEYWNNAVAIKHFLEEQGKKVKLKRKGTRFELTVL